MPCGFPTASSILPNRVEFQWIRCSWGNKTGRLVINAFLVRTTRTDQFLLNEVCYVSVVTHATEVSQIDTHTPLLESRFSFPNSCQCSVDCRLLRSALILIRSTSKETGRRLTDLVTLPFIKADPSGFREDKIPGLGTNTSTRSRDQYP